MTYSGATLDRTRTGIRAIRETDSGLGDPELAAFDRNVRDWELSATRALLIAVVSAAVLVLAITPFIGWTMAASQLVLCVIGFAHFALQRQWLATLAADPARSRQLAVLRWVWVTLEVSFASVALVIVMRAKGAEWAMTTPATAIYMFSIIAAQFRLRLAISVYAAALAAIQWLAVYYFALAPGIDPERAAAMGTLQEWAAWERVGWIVLAGGLLALFTSRLRNLALTSLRTSRERWAAVHELERLVSPDVAVRALSGALVPGASERRHVTALFCDLRDFTALCEHRRAEEALAILNAYYERACLIIRAHGGHVNKFLGDGVLALFGAPEDHPRHADAAIECAKQLVRAADELRAQGGVWEELQVGVGIDTGDVVLGAVGSSDRLEYTAIGATVNRAARLQALSSKTGRRIVLSARTAIELEDTETLLPLGEAPIKGVDRPVRIYTPR